MLWAATHGEPAAPKMSHGAAVASGSVMTPSVKRRSIVATAAQDRDFRLFHLRSSETRAAARDLVPDYLLVNHRRLPPDGEAPWPGPWEWMSWEVADGGLARQLRQRGVRYIETMAGAELLAELS